MNHKTDMQAPTEIYVWFADNKGTERDGERFIRAWTMDPVRADGLRGAIGKAPAVYRAIEASQSARVPEGEYKRMFEDAVRSLAAIDEALGIDPDEAGGAAPILEAIEGLQAALKLARETFFMNRIDVPRVIEKIDEALAAAPTPVADGGATFQARVKPWMLECFGTEIAADTVERNHRFFEEAAELVQSCGMTASEAHQLVDYTWGRPVGEKSQEVGGVMVTLAALCLANGLDMRAAGETELARINRPDMVIRIRAKQASKPKHSPLPEHAAPQPASVSTIVREALEAAFEERAGWRTKVAAAVRDIGPPQPASEQQDHLDTLLAVLNAIGYTEEFAAAHPDLKVSEGVKLFLALQNGAVECGAHIGPDCTECGGTGVWTGEQQAARGLSDEQVEAIMEQAQVFASAWSLVGGVFDHGDALETAVQEKANLRALLAAKGDGK